MNEEEIKDLRKEFDTKLKRKSGEIYKKCDKKMSREIDKAQEHILENVDAEIEDVKEFTNKKINKVEKEFNSKLKFFTNTSLHCEMMDAMNKGLKDEMNKKLKDLREEMDQKIKDSEKRMTQMVMGKVATFQEAVYGELDDQHKDMEVLNNRVNSMQALFEAQQAAFSLHQCEIRKHIRVLEEKQNSTPMKEEVVSNPQIVPDNEIVFEQNLSNRANKKRRLNFVIL